MCCVFCVCVCVCVCVCDGCMGKRAAAKENLVRFWTIELMNNPFMSELSGVLRQYYNCIIIILVF